ncbi:MAG: hypothetical protein AB7W16_23060 [Candidatus Obscuribacterales bacterium]
MNPNIVVNFVVAGLASGLIGFALLRCVHSILGRPRPATLAKILILAPFPAYWLVRLALAMSLLFDERRAVDCGCVNVTGLVVVELVSVCLAVAIFCIFSQYRRIAGARSLWSIGFASSALMFSSGCLFGLHADYRALATNHMTREALARGSGRSKAEIIELIGEPGAREGPLLLSGWPAEASWSEENWLYDFDVTNILVCFEHGRCSSVHTYGGMLEDTYNVWKADTVIDFARGKSKSEIYGFAGEPSFKSEPGAADRTGVDECWSYQFGSSHSAKLEFCEDICVDSHTCYIW